MAFTRSDATCTESGQREQFNIITAFIDGSNIYGSDDRRAEGLRLKSKGFLRTHSRGPTLPASKEAGGIRGIGGSKAFVAGDMRATEQPGLAAIHSLFVLEHNRLATQISSEDPSLLDEELYQRARRLNIGQIQNIVYNEFLPIVLGPTMMEEYSLNLPVSGTTSYDKSVNPGIFNEFATFAFRFGHSLIPDFFEPARKPRKTSPNIFPLKDTFLKVEECVLGKDLSGKAWQNLILGISTAQSPPMDAKVEESIGNFLFCEKCDFITGHGQDLAARNIQRGRDHGLPGYNEYRYVHSFFKASLQIY